MQTAEQDRWIERVLGISVRNGGKQEAPRPLKLRTPTPRPKPVKYFSVEGRALWMQAREQVDMQIEDLSEHLIGSGDADLTRIGQLGSAAITNRLGTSLLVALTEVDTAPAGKDAAARAKAKQAVSALQQLIDADPLVRILDQNPFGVDVSIRSTLGGALQQLEASLQ